VLAPKGIGLNGYPLKGNERAAGTGTVLDPTATELVTACEDGWPKEGRPKLACPGRMACSGMVSTLGSEFGGGREGF
jgi:hypothetical protein